MARTDLLNQCPLRGSLTGKQTDCFRPRSAAAAREILRAERWSRVERGR